MIHSADALLDCDIPMINCGLNESIDGYYYCYYYYYYYAATEMDSDFGRLLYAS